MAKKEVKNYGLHLTIDGYKANRKKLADVGLLYNTLNKLPALIGMTKVGFPHIIEFTEGDVAGISGFVFIMESHISVHTYSNKRFFSMDVYSCKHFDHRKIINLIQKVYEIKEIDKELVVRGKKFPVTC